MTYKEVFGDKKPVIGMIHTNDSERLTTLELAQKEIEIYLKYGVCPLIENYFGSADDCEKVLEWLQIAHPDATYGVNILGNFDRAIELANKYGAKFIQIDSICGHLKPKDDEEYARKLADSRKDCDAIILGGVRFKYQAVRSGRTQKEDLLIGKERCDAIVCTGEGTGMATPFKKVEEFKAVLGDFPVIVGAGVSLDTAKETFEKADGAIIGSWFKDGHRDVNNVNEEYVKAIVSAIDSTGKGN